MQPGDRKQGIYNYWPYISQLRYSKLVCGVLKVEGIYSIKMIPIREGSIELPVHENCGFFLPVNILKMWRVSFLGRTTYYCVS